MILVTGGTGLVGSHIIMQLLLSGHKVRALKRPGSLTALVEDVFGYYRKDFSSVSQNLEWTDADLLDYNEVFDSLVGVDTVYHCAALVSFDPADKKELFRFNPGTTATLVNASLDAGVETFCHISSVAALGRANQTGLVNENNWWSPAKANSNYSISKFTSEREVWRASEEGLNVVIVNPSVIIGPGNWHRGTGKLFTFALKGLKYYTGGSTGFVSAYDVADATIQLAASGIRNERFVLSSENLGWREFFNMVAKTLHKKAPGVYVGPFLSGLAWRMVKAGSAITGKKPFLTRESVEASQSKFRYSSEKISEKIGFRFTPVEETVNLIAECLLEDIKKGKLAVRL